MTYDDSTGHGRRHVVSIVGGVAGVAAVVAVAAAIAAGPRSPDRARSARLTESATPQALAAVALDHLDDEPSSVRRGEVSREARGAVTADLRFRAGEGSDGDLLRLSAVPGRADRRGHCGDFYRCAILRTGAGEVLLGWELEAPEEDPGLVFVVQQREDQYALAYQSSQPITADPRQLDLDISVDEMVAIVTDRRFGLTTTEETVRRGDDLPWRE